MIIKNTAQIRKHIPVNISLDIKNLQPFIVLAEVKYLIPLLSIEQYNDLDAYAASATKDDAKEELLQQCMAPVIWLALLDGFDLLNIQISDAGMHRNETDQKKGLYGYQERNIKAYLKNSGFNGLDNILAFLEEHIDDYQLWADSTACSMAYDSLIISAKEFTKVYAPLKDSSIVFRNMKSAMQRVEDFQLRTRIGDAIIDNLKELIQDREINDPANAKYKALLSYIHKPLAYLTVEESIAELGAKFTDMGLLFEEVNAGLIPDNISATNPDAKVQAIAKQCNATGRKYLSMLVDYLNAHTDDFPEYTEIRQIVEEADQSSKKIFRAY